MSVLRSCQLLRLYRSNDAITLTGENQSTSRETYFQCHLFTTSAICTGLGSNRASAVRGLRMTARMLRTADCLQEPVAGAVSNMKADGILICCHA